MFPQENIGENMIYYQWDFTVTRLCSQMPYSIECFQTRASGELVTRTGGKLITMFPTGTITRADPSAGEIIHTLYTTV